MLNTRTQIDDIIYGKDSRKILIVGPCSIHNIEDAKEYGLMLYDLALKVKDKFLIVMRVYFEKPRTTIGWKGLINDPCLDNTFKVNKGLELARDLLYYLNKIGMPCGCEFLDTITPHYISDLICWGAIGANNDGNACIIKTNGNFSCHTILRGGKNAPNYRTNSIDITKKKLEIKSIIPRIMVDCSHDNSEKDHRNQKFVFENVIKQITNGEESIIGLMLESNINSGKQDLKYVEETKLKKGVSITDSCINFKETEEIILNAYTLL